MVGTASSGDATIARLLSAIPCDFEPRAALTTAVAVGARNVEAADTLSGIRPWEQTMTRIAQGWPKQPLKLSAEGWRFDGDRQIWVGPAAGSAFYTC